MNRFALIAIIGWVVSASTYGAEILVTEDIETSTTWTADNVYNLQNQIYVLPGATLTIMAINANLFI
jgi:hypothetical protein